MYRPPRKFYFDTEFLEHDVLTADGRKIRAVELISIGMVDERGRKFYAVSSEFDRAAAEKNAFIRNNVLSQLPPETEWKPMAQIQKDLFAFIGTQEADFYHWQAPHDALLLYDLMAPRAFLDTRPRMMNVRENLHMVINIGQKFNDAGRPRNILPPRPGNLHDALADAEWNRQADKAIDDYRVRAEAARIARPPMIQP